MILLRGTVSLSRPKNESKFNTSIMKAPQEVSAFITPVTYEGLHVTDRYDCIDVEGFQVCFTGVIFDSLEDLRRDHNWHNGHDNPFGFQLKHYIPISLFYGKKEGDTVSLRIENIDSDIITVRLTLYSKDCIGRNFEDILHGRTSSLGGIISSPYDISELEQGLLIIEAHKKYSASINLPEVKVDNFKYLKQWIEGIHNNIK